MSKLRSLARLTTRPLVRLVSRAYIAGPELADATATLSRFARLGVCGSIGYFNADDEAPRRVADFDLAAIDAMSTGRLDCYLSVKAPALKFDLELVEALAHRARSAGVALHFDSHGLDATEPTFAAILKAREHTDLVGCTLPSRWSRSLADVYRAVELGLRVRVVKGQWDDPIAPHLDQRANYLAIIDKLAGRARAVGVATHDPTLAKSAIERLKAAGTPCELELLYGLPMRAAAAIARSANVPIRVYVPFGAAWMPYALSQLRRKPGIAWWVVKDALAVLARKDGF